MLKSIFVVAGRNLTEYGYIGRPHYFIKVLSRKFEIVVLNSPQYWKSLFRRPSKEYMRYLSGEAISIIDGYPVRIYDIVLYDTVNFIPNIVKIISIAYRKRPSCIVSYNVVLGVFLSFICRLMKIPLVFDFTDYYPLMVSKAVSNGKEKKLFYFVAKYIATALTILNLRKSDVVVACSLWLYDYAKKVGAKRIFFIPNGVEVKAQEKHFDMARLYEMYNLNERNVIVGYVGGLRFLDVKLIVECFKILKEKNPNVKLMIVGDGPQASELKALLKRNSLYESSIFLGKVEKSEVDNVIKTMDVCIIPFNKDVGYTLHPLKLLEYLINCKPVVSVPMYGLSRVFGKDIYQCVSIASSPEEFARAIDDALKRKTEPQFLKSLLKVKTLIEKKYSWQVLSKKFEDLICSICCK